MGILSKLFGVKNSNGSNIVYNQKMQDESPTDNSELNSFDYSNANYIPDFVEHCNHHYFNGDLIYSLSQIEEIISHPQDYPMAARRLGKWAYDTDGAIKSGVNKMSTSHYLSYVLFNPNSNDSESVVHNKEKFNCALRKIRYKNFIRDCIKKVAIEGTAYYYFEVRKTNSDIGKYMSDTDVSFVREINGLNRLSDEINLYSLPFEYCQIVSRRNGVPIIAFNVKYFIEQCTSDVEIKRQLSTMPLEIVKAFEKWHKTGNEGKSWVVLDWRKTIYITNGSTDRDKWGVPLALTSLDEIMYANYFTDTKRGVLSNINNNLVYETFPIRGDGSGKSTLTDAQQREQHNALKSAVTQKSNSQRTAVLSLAAGTQLNNLKIDTSLFDEKNEKSIKDNIAESLGFSPSALYGGSKSSGSNYATALLNLELVASDTYSIIEKIVDELNKCINFNIIKDINGIVNMYVLPITSFNRDKYFDKFKSIYSDCGGAMTPLIAATGIEPDVYIDIMRHERKQKYDEIFPPHQSMYTLSGKEKQQNTENKGGRPDVDNLENENTITSKNNNANLSPSSSK